jgi:hypothetical protein
MSCYGEQQFATALVIECVAKKKYVACVLVNIIFRYYISGIRAI